MSNRQATAAWSESFTPQEVRDLAQYVKGMADATQNVKLAAIRQERATMKNDSPHVPDFKRVKEFVGPTLEYIINEVRAWAKSRAEREGERA
jgi:hypothetical protein